MAKNENELILLASNVLKQYNFVPEDIIIIQSDVIKTVWKFKANNGVFCLKRLKQTIDKALFSVNAQIYIKASGGNVPAICLNKQGEPIARYNEELFVVYEWLNGRDLNFNNRNDLAQAIAGLAKFHLCSKKYKAVEGARISTKLGKWPSQYESMKSKLIGWKETARANTNPDDKTYLNCVEPIIILAEQAIKVLKESKYMELTATDSTAPVLCHQDFGKGNAILTDTGIIVLDLDGVSFDLPSRDLRKIIGKMAENNSFWNSNQIKDILYWYTQINSITDEEKKVLYIDLLFPHWFFGLIKNKYINMKTLKSTEIEKITKLELSKLPIIEELLMR